MYHSNGPTRVDRRATDGSLGLRHAVRHMPITPVTDAVRDLLSGRHPGTFWAGLGWCVAVLLAGRVWAALVWRRGA